MIVAIPSHYRSKDIMKYSLKFVMEELKVPPTSIYIFVSNKEQVLEYTSTIPFPVNIINADTTCVRDKFNYIHSYFKDGQDVLLVEDDVKGCVSIVDRSIKGIIEYGFKVMHQNNACIWGMYPSSNKLFMQHSVLTGFGFIVANIYGFKADGDNRVLVQEHSKCDYERSLLYSLHKGGVVRLNYVAPKTNNYTNKGGMQMLDNRAEVESIACDNLVRRYPNHIGYKNGTKSKYKEIKLLRK